MVQDGAIEGYTLSNKDSLQYENNEQYAISRDRLVLNLTAKESRGLFNHYGLERDYKGELSGVYKINDNFFLNLRRCSEGTYLYSYDVSIEGRKIGKIHTDNKKRGCGKLIKLEFINDVHYSLGRDILWYYIEIIEALSLRLHNISYVEIALDTYDMLERYRYMYLNSTVSYGDLFALVGKIKVNSLENNTQFVIGSRKTGKRISIYNKSEEVKTSRKDYITDSHKHKGLDTTRQIDRVELRMDSRWIKKYKLTHEMLVDEKGLCAIFQEFTKDSLQFKDLNTMYFDSNRNKKYQHVSLIDYSLFDCRPLEQPQRKQKVSAHKTTRGIKGAFKHHLNHYISSGRSGDIALLKNFMVREENWLIESDEYVSHFGELKELQKVSMCNYSKLVIKYINEYEGFIDDAVVGRMQNLYSLLFSSSVYLYTKESHMKPQLKNLIHEIN